ncbi:MAG TPA: hypothetical protein VKQ09_04630 [Sphingomonas sp.]|nr:hypothetical protein [Sphingomonas sp.]
MAGLLFLGKPADLAATLEPPSPGPALIYNSLVLIRHLLMQVDPPSNWAVELKQLLAAHPTGDLAAMGFPNGWDSRPLWL